MASDDREFDERDDREYDDRPPRRRRARAAAGGPNWLLWGGVGCVLVAGCGGLLAVGVAFGVRAFVTDLPAATAAADRFLDHLRQNRIDDPYAATTAGFKGRQSADQFRAFVGRFETLTTATSRTTNGFRIFHGPAGKQAFLQVTLHAPNNATTCTLTLVDEGGAWKVDNLTVP